MIREVSLIDYLPLFIQGYDEIKKIMDAENPEFQLLWNADEQIRNNLFVLTADEIGVKRYERLLKIYPSTDDSIETRKARIIIRINEQPPYTMQALNNQLKTVCGAGNYLITLDANDYLLTINLFNLSHNTYLDVRSMLNRMLPANMMIITVAQHDLPACYIDIRNKKYNIAAFHKTVLSWDLFIQAGAETEVGITPVVQVYQRTAIN